MFANDCHNFFSTPTTYKQFTIMKLYQSAQLLSLQFRFRRINTLVCIHILALQVCEVKSVQQRLLIPTVYFPV